MNDRSEAKANDAAQKALKSYMEKAAAGLSNAMDSGGANTQTLSAVIGHFFTTLIPLPDDAVCKKGCAYCCHLRVGVSIPEAIVIFHQLIANTTTEGLNFFRKKVIDAARQGDTLTEQFWQHSKTPCPFLDVKNQQSCLIYELRPFSCRAFHSTDIDACKRGFFEKESVKIPCFPMYRAFTDVHTTLLIQEMEKRGLFSYQVGFVAALALLFESKNPSALVDDWFDGKDVFNCVRLR